MFDGTIRNAATPNGFYLSRLTIGITTPDGKRAEMVFERAARDNQTLVTVNTGAETSGTDAAPEPPAPTERQLNEDYLLKSEWQRQTLAGIGVVWSDPLSGGDYTFANAVDIQTARDLRDAANDGKAICQDDYEFMVRVQTVRPVQ